MIKKILTLALLALASIGTANAQRAAEYDVAYKNSDISSYNRVGISYNNTGMNLKGHWSDNYKNTSVNGVGVDYIHGFSLTSNSPMFLEVGGNINFNFGDVMKYKSGQSEDKENYQDINLQVPVNYVYRFNVTDDLFIAPFVGLNFKLHLMSQTKYEETYRGETYKGDWESCFDKDYWDPTWNRFQMGWHVGVNFQYSKISLGIQYGTDFISAYSDTEDVDNTKVNTGNLKITLGYNF